MELTNQLVINVVQDQLDTAFQNWLQRNNKTLTEQNRNQLEIEFNRKLSINGKVHSAQNEF